MTGGILLVAEDDATDAFLLDRAMKKSGGGMQMHRVATGDELIQYLQGVGRYSDRTQFPLPDAVLLDLKMPGKDGFSVLQWRLAEKTAKLLPVIVFSSSSLATDIARAYELGASSYVVKPSNPARLHDFAQALKTWWREFNSIPARALT